MKRLYFICCLLLVLLLDFARVSAQPFITKWNLATAGSAPTQITFGVGTTGTVNYSWETIPAAQSGAGTFSGVIAVIPGLPAGAMIRLSIDTGGFKRFIMYNGQDKNRLLDVEQWGAVHWGSMANAFHGCSNLTISANDVPDFSATSNMSSMFQSCAVLNGPANIGNWNTQQVSNMANLFSGAFNFNQPIGNWNTQNVTNMSGMFNHAVAFNQPIGNWNTQNVSTMEMMFFGAVNFNQPIDSWNTQNVTSMQQMFRQAPLFNQPLNSWNTSSVTNMFGMFQAAQNFNQPLSNWNVQNVGNMSSMFNGAVSFNQPIGNWNTQNLSNVVSMFNGAVSFNQTIENWNMQGVGSLNNMFANAISFNQPLAAWNTQNVTHMVGAFSGATSFNQPIGNWNTASVLSMQSMFFGATAFNQPLSNWNTGSVTQMSGMFNQAISFNQPIAGWNTGNVISMQGMFTGASAFNQPIGNWNTSNVNNMFGIFSGATAFNQNLGSWPLSFNVNLNQALDSCGMNCVNYSYTLIGWYAQPNCPYNRTLGVAGLGYGSSAQGIRNNLVSIMGWNLIGDSLTNAACCVSQSNSVAVSACKYYPYNGQLLVYDGTYVNVFPDQYGCDSVVTLNFTLTPVITSVIQAGNTLGSLSQNGSWKWLKCNPWQVIPGEIGKYFTAATNGDYAVAVTENGCTDTSACFTVSGLGISPQAENELIRIYPNPASDVLFIESPRGFRHAQIRVRMVSGEVLAEYADMHGSKISIDCSPWSSGLYFVEVLDEAGKSVRKIRKQ